MESCHCATRITMMSAGARINYWLARFIEQEARWYQAPQQPALLPPPFFPAYGMANEVLCCGPGADRAKIKGSMKSLLSKAAMEI